MAVSLVSGWQCHVIAINYLAEVCWLGRPVVFLSLERDGFVGPYNLDGKALIEPCAIGVHEFSTLAKQMADETEYGKYAFVENFVTPSGQQRVVRGYVEIDFHRQFAGYALQTWQNAVLIGKDVNVESSVSHVLQCRFCRAIVHPRY